MWLITNIDLFFLLLLIFLSSFTFAFSPQLQWSRFSSLPDSFPSSLNERKRYVKLNNYWKEKRKVYNIYPNVGLYASREEEASLEEIKMTRRKTTKNEDGGDNGGESVLNIIGNKRIEDMKGFRVERNVVDGITFVKLDDQEFSSSSPSLSPSNIQNSDSDGRVEDDLQLTSTIDTSGDSSSRLKEDKMKKAKRRKILFLPGLDGSGCTLTPQLEFFKERKMFSKKTEYLKNGQGNSGMETTTKTTPETDMGIEVENDFEFEIHSLSIAPSNRSPLNEVVDEVVTYILKMNELDRVEETRKQAIVDSNDTNGSQRASQKNGIESYGQEKDIEIVVIGESFGGLLALLVALKLDNLNTTANFYSERNTSKEGSLPILDSPVPNATKYIKSLLLINPASSYNQTPWPFLLSIFQNIPPPLYPFLVTPTLLGVGPDITQFQLAFEKILRVDFNEIFLTNMNNNRSQNRNKGDFSSNPFSSILSLPKQLLSSTSSSLLMPSSARTLQKNIVDLLQNAIEVGNKTETNLEVIKELFSLLEFLFKNIPLDTLIYRTSRWLQYGCYRLNDSKDSLLRSITIPTVILAGTEDRLLPSEKEAKRLKKSLGGPVNLIYAEGSGHILMDKRVRLDTILFSHHLLFGNQTTSSRMTSRLPSTYSGGQDSFDLEEKDMVENFRRPSIEYIEKYTSQIDKYLTQFTSPRFFSVASGETDFFYPNRTNLSHKLRAPYVEEGVPNISKYASKRPILLVGNHQTYGIDLGLIIKEFLDSEDILVRGLAHPALFARSKSATSSEEVAARLNEQIRKEDEIVVDTRSQLIREIFEKNEKEHKVLERKQDENIGEIFGKFGAVPVSGRNFFKLFQNNETVLLFPGGAAETYHRKNESYTMFWPSQAEFVKMCKKFNALIIPFSAIGAADSVNILLDKDDLIKLPLGVGDRIQRLSNEIPNARGSQGIKEDFIAPISIPKLPSRFYFLFHEPIDFSKDFHKQIKDEDVYSEVRRKVEVGIDALLEARESDPLRNPFNRLLYERLERWNKERSAPTNSVKSKSHLSPTFKIEALEKILYSKLMEQTGASTNTRKK